MSARATESTLTIRLWLMLMLPLMPLLMLKLKRLHCHGNGLCVHHHVYSRDIYLDMSLFNHIVPFASVFFTTYFPPFLAHSAFRFVNLENFKGKNDLDGHEFYPYFCIIPLNE